MTVPPTPETDGQEWTIDVSIDSDPNQANDLIRDVLLRLEQLGWEGRDLFGVHMALEEALMNAIKHGNCRDIDKNVEVKMRFDDAYFVARIEDEGCGFDPRQVPDPTSCERLEAESGRGLALIRNFMDSVQFNEVGNVIEMEKHRNS